MDAARLSPLMPPESILRPDTLVPALAAQGLRLLVANAIDVNFGDYMDRAMIQAFTFRDDDAHVDLPFNPMQDSFLDLLDRLPEGWTPDLVLYFHPEYLPIPRDLEHCPYPLVGLVGDWNIGMRDMLPCLGIFDLLVGDAGFVEAAQDFGLSNVHYWPMYSFFPPMTRPEFVHKDLDVTFIGNMSATIHRVRNRLLHRLARLSDRHRVHLASGVFGEDYINLMRRSKLVFNFTVRRELNLRCYEAPACGAMVLIEDSNLEARHLLRDGQDCAYYDESNLEAVIARYLEDDATREAIARSGEARVRESSFTTHFSSLLTIISRYFEQNPPGTSRPFRNLPRVEQWHALGRKAYRSAEHRTHFPYTERLLLAAHELAPENAAILADLGTLYASWSLEAEGALRDVRQQTARHFFERALALEPHHPTLNLNVGMFYAQHDGALASAHLERVLTSVPGDDAAMIFPLNYDRQMVELDRAFSLHRHDPDARRAAAHDIYRWRAAEILGDLSTAPARRTHWYRMAVALQPDLPETQFKLGQALVQEGALTEAVEALRIANADDPFKVEIAQALAEALFRLDRIEESQAVVEDYHALQRAFHPPEPVSS